MEIKYEKGYAIDKSVEIIVNSANNFLLLGGSGAGRIRDVSKKLTILGHLKYNLLLLLLPKYIKKWFLKTYKNHNWKPSQAQLNCLYLLFKNKKPFERGSAVIEKSKTKNKKIIHAVEMSYDIHNKKRMAATEETIKNSVDNATKKASELNIKSLSIPVMCARKSYGVSPEKSLKIIKETLKEYLHTSIKKVIICFDNKKTEKYLNQIKK